MGTHEADTEFWGRNRPLGVSWKKRK